MCRTTRFELKVWVCAFCSISCWSSSASLITCDQLNKFLGHMHYHTTSICFWFGQGGSRHVRCGTAWSVASWVDRSSVFVHGARNVVDRSNQHRPDRANGHAPSNALWPMNSYVESRIHTETFQNGHKYVTTQKFFSRDAGPGQ